MLNFLQKHKAPIIITVIAVIFAVITVSNLIEAQPSDSVLTVAFVDAAGNTSGSTERIAKSFAPHAKQAFATTYNDPAYAIPGADPATVLRDGLLDQSADVVILDQVALEVLAKANMLSPLTCKDDRYAQKVDGVCYGFIIDGADLTGSLDIIAGYNAPDVKDRQFFCCAVLNGCNNKTEALAAMDSLQERLILQLNQNKN